MKSESYHLFRVKTRRQAVKQSSGWKCFVYDFFNNLRFIGKGKYRKDAGAGGVRGTGEDGEREAANAVDACCGDGGVAGVSGGSGAGGGGVYQGARRAADGYGGGCEIGRASCRERG